MGTGTGITGWLRVAAGARCRECLASSSPASPEALSLLFSGCRCLLHLSLCPSLCGSVLSHCLHLCVCLRYPTCLFSGAVSAATCLCPSIFGSTSDFVFSWALHPLICGVRGATPARSSPCQHLPLGRYGSRVTPLPLFMEALVSSFPRCMAFPRFPLVRLGAWAWQ